MDLINLLLMIKAKKGGSGGGGETSLDVSEKDVNLYDYNGVRVYSYTKEQFLTLTAYPEENWYWYGAGIAGYVPLTTAQDLVRKTGWLDLAKLRNVNEVARNYEINAPESYNSGIICCRLEHIDTYCLPGQVVGNKTLPILVYTLRASDSIGTISLSGTTGAAREIPEAYQTDYALAIFKQSADYSTDRITAGVLFANGVGSKPNTAVTYNCDRTPMSAITEIAISDYGLRRLGSIYAFRQCSNLRSVSEDVTRTTSAIFDIGVNQMFAACPNLDFVFMCDGFANYMFAHSPIKKALILYRTSSISPYISSGALSSAYKYTKVKQVTYFGNDMFALIENTELYRVAIQVNSIPASTFDGCTSLQKVYILNNTPPILNNVNAFNNVHENCKFYVPYSADHSVLNAYKTATNWSVFADQMEEMPE